MASLTVKIGGHAASDDGLITALGEEFKNLSGEGIRVLLVHGGGPLITDLQNRYGVSPRFVEGLRQTTPEEMNLVDMALTGGVNTHIVRRFLSCGLDAWGLCGADGGLMLAEGIGGPKNRTGKVRAVNTRPVELLWDAGYLPVCASPASDSKSRGMNVNADEAALALSTALKVERLVFISDVPGIRMGQTTARHTTAEELTKAIAAGAITGGMIPKAKAAMAALENGMEFIAIGAYTKAGDLALLLSGEKGTAIVRENEKNR